MNLLAGAASIIVSGALIALGFYFILSDAGVGGNTDHHVRALAGGAAIILALLILWYAGMLGYMGGGGNSKANGASKAYVSDAVAA